MGAFRTRHESLRAVSAWRKAPFASLSPHRKFPFPARVETGSVTGWSLPAPVRLAEIFGPVSLRLKISLPATGRVRSVHRRRLEFDHAE
jgi:hypothetical protein